MDLGLDLVVVVALDFTDDARIADLGLGFGSGPGSVAFSSWRGGGGIVVLVSVVLIALVVREELLMLVPVLVLLLASAASSSVRVMVPVVVMAHA